MTCAVAGWPPVRLLPTGDPHADSNPASVTPPPAARNWRRDIEALMRVHFPLFGCDMQHSAENLFGTEWGPSGGPPEGYKGRLVRRGPQSPVCPGHATIGHQSGRRSRHDTPR